MTDSLSLNDGRLELGLAFFWIKRGSAGVLVDCKSRCDLLLNFGRSKLACHNIKKLIGYIGIQVDSNTIKTVMSLTL